MGTNLFLIFLEYISSFSPSNKHIITIGMNINITNLCKVQGYLGFFSNSWSGEDPSQRDYVWLGADSETGRANVLQLRSRVDGTGTLTNTYFVAGHFYKGEYTPSETSTLYLKRELPQKCEIEYYHTNNRWPTQVQIAYYYEHDGVWPTQEQIDYYYEHGEWPN